MLQMPWHTNLYIAQRPGEGLLALRPGEGLLESAHLVQLYSASRRGRRAVVLINSRCVLLPFHLAPDHGPHTSPQGDGSDPYADELRAVPLGTDSRGARYFFFATEQQVCFCGTGFLGLVSVVHVAPAAFVTEQICYVLLHVALAGAHHRPVDHWT